jgi:hypothetical protein
VDEAIYLSDRIVLMSNGPAAHIGEIVKVAIPRPRSRETLLDDPEYKKLYIEDGLQPGFMPHDQYVAFMNEFGNETAAFLKQSGVIR